MTEKFLLKDNKYPKDLHDWRVSNVEIIDNRLVFYFNADGAPEFTVDGKGAPVFDADGNDATYPYKYFKVIFVMEEGWNYSGDVGWTDLSKKSTKDSLKEYTIQDCVAQIGNTEFTMEIISQTYNSRYCIVSCVYWNKTRRNSAPISLIWELPVEEIIYEWEKK